MISCRYDFRPKANDWKSYISMILALDDHTMELQPPPPPKSPEQVVPGMDYVSQFPKPKQTPMLANTSISEFVQIAKHL